MEIYFVCGHSEQSATITDFSVSSLSGWVLIINIIYIINLKGCKRNFQMRQSRNFEVRLLSPDRAAFSVMNLEVRQNGGAGIRN